MVVGLRASMRTTTGPCPTESPLCIPRVASILLLLLLAFTAAGQKLGPAKNFKLADTYSGAHEGQLKSLIEGGQGQQLPDGRFLLTGNVKLHTFLENGQPEFDVKTPQCFQDPKTQSANSSERLHVQTADGKFSIEGEGFLWQQTNSSLFISNHVHTVIEPELLQGSGARPSSSNADSSPVEIFSDRFAYDRDSGLGVYTGHVRVAGTNLFLSGGKLVVKMPMTGARTPTGLQVLTALENVSMDYLITNFFPIHATGQRVVYTPATGLARFTGSPVWRSEQREGRGDELVIDRTNKIFQANGKAWLKLPRQSFETTGLLSRSNAPRAGTLSVTNQFVEIQSDSYEFRTNWGNFLGHVRVSERNDALLQERMSCDRMLVTFGQSNQLQRIVADQHVVIQEEDKRLTGGHAVYTATNNLLELTAQPTWQAGRRQGKGDLVRINTQSNEMFVRGEASMRLPADELPQTAGVGPAGANTPPNKAATNQFAQTFSQQYTVRPESAVFRGGVYVSHPRMNWICESLTVTAPTNGAKTIVAEGKVVFDLIDEHGQKVHGLGDHSVYSYSVVGGQTNDTIEVIGRPARLETASLTNENGTIILDRTHNTLSMPGSGYKIMGAGKAIPTNTFVLPKK